MNYYHGTDKINDSKILEPTPNVDIDKGGGEIGKGFYTTNDEWIAIAWSVGRFGEGNASVLEINIGKAQEKAPYSLTIHLIKTQEEVIKIWKTLKAKGETRTFTFGKDIISAPFATIDAARQYKFESSMAESIINSSQIRKIY